jgi:uncharacterized protein YecE (DUF72 family)
MIRIGTSGWQYDDWRGRFYDRALARRHWLASYASRFATVELNATFYGLPDPGRYEEWAAETPPDFLFAVKASRYLTHTRRLRDPAGPVERLLEGADRLGPKLGPVLLQLPPTMRIDVDRLDTALAAFPGTVRVAVEARHPTWFVPETLAVLRIHGAALCIADVASRLSPIERTADWSYIRLHRGRASPTPCYGRRAIAAWAKRLAWLAGDGRDAFVYFNNDPGSCAPHDAALLVAACRRLDLAVTRAPRPGSISVHGPLPGDRGRPCPQITDSAVPTDAIGTADPVRSGLRALGRALDPRDPSGR